MSYKPELSPHASIPEAKVRLALAGLTNAEEMQVFRTWIEYDSHVKKPEGRGRPNWNAILGIAIIVIVSLGFWAGVGLLVARYWR